MFYNSKKPNYLLVKLKECNDRSLFVQWLHSRLGRVPLKHYRAYIDKFGYTADTKLAIAITHCTKYNGLNLKDLNFRSEFEEYCIAIDSGEIATMYGVLSLEAFKLFRTPTTLPPAYNAWVHYIYNIPKTEFYYNISLCETLCFIGFKESYEVVSPYLEDSKDPYKVLYTLASEPSVVTYFQLGLSKSELDFILETTYNTISSEVKKSLQNKLLWAFVGEDYVTSKTKVDWR